MKKKSLKEIKAKFTADRNNYMTAFRKNIFAYIEGKETTLNQIAEEADIPYSTLKTFLYSDSKDCNLSTAVKLARAFGVSIDRLIGAETIDLDILDFGLAYKELSKPTQARMRWYISDEKYTHSVYKDQVFVKVSQPICNGNGNLKRTYDYERIDISHLGEEYTHKIFLGIRIPCDHLLPHYAEGEILLLANDRDAMKNEHTVLRINDNIIITKRIVENGKVGYYGIRDNICHSDEAEHFLVIGYVAKVIE